MEKDDQVAGQGEGRGTAGVLYVVATPIGNLEDITLRAVRILNEVDLIAAEDTRHTRKLLAHLDIHTPLVSYYKDKEQERAESLIQHLRAGRQVALVSDAGTPAISDPGAILVGQAREAGVRVVPVPGPSALTAALSVSGLAAEAWLFVGFLPSKKAQRRQLLTSLAGREELLVFYESPHRILHALADCLAILGDRPAFLARELTKLHEEGLRGGLAEILRSLEVRSAVKGEFVVLVGGADQEARPDGAELDVLLRWCRDQAGYSMRDAVRKLSQDLGLPRTEVYQEALRVWREEAD